MLYRESHFRRQQAKQHSYFSFFDSASLCSAHQWGKEGKYKNLIALWNKNTMLKVEK